MFHSEKTDFRSASRIFSSEIALDYRAQSARTFCPQCGVSTPWGAVVGYTPSALGPKVGEVPRQCPLWPVHPPALRVRLRVSLGAFQVLVKSHLEQKSWGSGAGKFPLRSAFSFLT